MDRVIPIGWSISQDNTWWDGGKPCKYQLNRKRNEIRCNKHQEKLFYEMWNTMCKISTLVYEKPSHWLLICLMSVVHHTRTHYSKMVKHILTWIGSRLDDENQACNSHLSTINKSILKNVGATVEKRKMFTGLKGEEELLNLPLSSLLSHI